MAITDKTPEFSFREGSRFSNPKGEESWAIQQLFSLIARTREDLPPDLLKQVVHYFSEAGHLKEGRVSGNSPLPFRQDWRRAASKFKQNKTGSFLFDKSALLPKEDLKSDLHQFMLLYFKVNKDQIEGAWLLPDPESLEYIIALKEFTLDARSEFYDLLDLLKENEIFSGIQVRFHLIPASEVPNLNTEKVEPLHIAA
jgi:hypothetical protein